MNKLGRIFFEVKSGEFDQDVFKPLEAKDRTSFSGMLLVFIGMWFCLFGTIIGFAIGASMPFRYAMPAIVLGYFLAGIVQALIAPYGQKEGLSTYPLTRRPLGKGMYLFAALNFVVFMWAFGMQADVVGRAMGATAGFGWNPWISAGLAALMVTTAYLGYKHIERLSKLTVPLFFIVFLVATFIGISRLGGGLSELWNSAPETTTMDFFTATTMSMVAFIGLAIMGSDVGRFGRTSRAVVGASILSFLIGGLVPLMGATVAACMHLTDFSQLFPAVGLGWFGAIAMLAAAWTTNDNNGFSGGLALSAITHFKRKVSTVIIGIGGVVAAYLGLGSTAAVITVMMTLAQLVPPVGGLLIAQRFYLDRRGIRGNPYMGVATWIIAVLLVRFVVPGIATVNGILIGIALYIGLVEAWRYFTRGKLTTSAT